MLILARSFQNTTSPTGVSDPKPTSNRHSFASHLFESGTDIKYIQSLLGHVMNCSPMCQEFPKEKWVDARREDLLDAPYFHPPTILS